MFKLYCRIYQAAFRLATPLLPWRKPTPITNYKHLRDVLTEADAKKVLLVTDRGLTSLGLHDKIVAALARGDIECIIYDKTVPNPTVENIEEALSLYLKHGCKATIALGGGSPMDCAKGVGARLAKPKKSVEQLMGPLKILKKIPLLIAIPTTAGTGSETTVAAVITDPVNHRKYAINDPSLIPHYCILDPHLTVGLPPFITATTGVDALSHAVEAYIGHSNTKETKKEALMAAKLIFENLYTAYCDGANIEARKKMLRAAFLAGAAFTRAYVGNIHAIGHSFGAKYGTAHGLAMSVIMPHILDIYGEKVYKPLAEMADAVGVGSELSSDSSSDREKAKLFIQAIRDLNKKMGIPETLSDLREEDIPAMAKHALKEANPLYPVPIIFNKAEMECIYRRLLVQ